MTESSAPEALRAVWCGRESFSACLQRQIEAREALVAGEGPPTLFLVEHPPTLTIGRRGHRDDVLWPPELLDRHGMTVVETPRGGEVTLHAPGQLVVYPVVHVGRKIRAHIVRLAEITMGLLGELGVEGLEFRMESPGVWLGRRKVASIGIHISRGVAIQGLSVNLDVDPDLFGSLISCGMGDVEMISAASLVQRVPTVEEAARRWAAGYAAALDAALEWQAPEPAPPAVLS